MKFLTGQANSESRMKDAGRLRSLGKQLAAILAKAGEDRLQGAVLEALESTDDRFEEFLRSNDLWGGSGSIADQAGIDENGKLSSRKEIAAALIALGDEQLQQDVSNMRTKMWVTAFQKWLQQENW